ncbi:MAG: hypothetical protein JRI90_17035, partial [Deltaproteobacteria bacterium]|nr:hypothetical protein [Deltaproteobacteria bacterium]
MKIGLKEVARMLDLPELRITELLEHNYHVVHPEMRLREFVELLKRNEYHFFSV